jgi:hypothetical protein
MPNPGLMGKLPAKQLPMISFGKYVKSDLPTPPASFDYGHKVSNFPLALNDTYGDCTIAGVVHMLQLAYAEVGEVFEYPGDEAVKETYFRLTGGADGGLVMVDVLQEWTKNGLFGVKLAAWTPVNKTNWQEMKAAAYCFGGLYVGVEMPSEAQTQFAENDVWHIDENSGPPVGGHCITISGFNRLGADIETWGAETALTRHWWNTYGSEAFAVIPEIFVEKKHGPLANIDIKTLQQDLINL